MLDTAGASSIMQGMQKLSVEQAGRIRELRRAGLTLAELSGLYGVTKQRVQQICGPGGARGRPKLAVAMSRPRLGE